VGGVGLRLTKSAGDAARHHWGWARRLCELPACGAVQECNSYVEGLPCKTFHDVYAYEWAQKLRDKASIIQDEFRRVAIQGSDDLDKKGNNVWATAANATSAQSYGVCVCNIHTYTHTLSHTQTHTHTHTHTCVCVCVRVCMRVCVYI